MHAIKTIIAVALGAAFASSPVWAKLTDAEVSRLGKDLTPLGGEMVGNKDGTIPAYTGGLTKAPACYKAGVEYCDPFPEDKPKFEITSANAEQYKDKLPAGAIALLKKYPTFKMPIYETRRTAAVPAEVADAVKKEATRIELKDFGIVNRGVSTTPFPIPTNGLEAIWNHLVRYRGGSFQRVVYTGIVRANGDQSISASGEEEVFNEFLDRPKENLLFVFRSRTLIPAALAGNMTLVHEPVDQVREQRSAWQYNSGQRRVKRAPDVAYDGMSDAVDGLRFYDQVDAYNGAPDRFEWKLVGKKEMYVPYNTYRITDKKRRLKEVLTKNHLPPELTRYELHRVWVVEATLKEGQRHVLAKRTFLLDEDSWNILWEDGYDSRGELWRIGVHPLIQYYDVLVPWARFSLWHDLSNGAYVVQGLDNDADGTTRFGKRGRLADFESGAMRQSGL